MTGILPGRTTVVAEVSGCWIFGFYALNVTEIPNGTYFLKNKKTEKYVDIEDQEMAEGTQIVQWVFNGEDAQRWLFTHLGDGSYSIRSANSALNYYLGVQNDATATDTPVVLRTGSLTNGMKWKISKTTSGAYKITPKTGESNNRVLAVGFYVLNNNGIDIKQRDYIDDTNYKDEWYIENVQTFAYKTFASRVYYDLSIPINSSEINLLYANATAAFLTNFNIKFFRESTSYSALLNCNPICHAVLSTDICTDECADLSACNTLHHRGSYRLINILTDNNYYTYRLVGYAVCYYSNEYSDPHRKVVGLGNVNGKNSISSYAISPDITRSIQHELTHNLGGTHTHCTPNQQCVLKGDFNCWCDSCKLNIKNNY